MKVVIGFPNIGGHITAPVRLKLRNNGLFNESLHAFLCASRAKHVWNGFEWHVKHILCTSGDKGDRTLQLMVCVRVPYGTPVTLPTPMFWTSV
jgi:hypothetical protein